MDLFEYMREQKKESESPLASRLRPKTLDEMVGQQHIIGKDKLLYRAISADKLSSIILYDAGNRKDDARQSDRQYHLRRVYADQCHLCGEEGYGGGDHAGKE